MVLPRVSPNDPPEAQVAVLNQVIDFINQAQKVQVLQDDTSQRFIQGYYPGRWPGGDFGIAIAKSGDDVTSVDFEELAFAHDFSTNTQYWNFNGVNYMQVGTLPDSTGGWAVAKPGANVSAGF